MDLKGLLGKIDRNRDLLRERCRLTPQQITNFDNHFRIINTFTSNAIEGNRLSLIDTRLVLEDRISVGGKNMKDLLETYSHGKTFDLMLDIARENSLESISNDFLHIISEIHQSFYGLIDKKFAGVYREVDVMIGGASIVPPAPEELNMSMDNFKVMFNKFKNTYHPICLAAYAHLRLVQIHPFIDGNGRTSRLLMNLILVNQGYQIISLDMDDRDRYYNALKKSDKQDYKDNVFYELTAELQLKAQKEYMIINHIEDPGPDPPDPPSSPHGGERMR
jgi:Fic family protein